MEETYLIKALCGRIEIKASDNEYSSPSGFLLFKPIELSAYCMCQKSLGFSIIIRPDKNN